MFQGYTKLLVALDVTHCWKKQNKK